MPKYKLPTDEKWFPIETAPLHQKINIRFADGELGSTNYQSETWKKETAAIFWQPIAPLEVERFELVQGAYYYYANLVDGCKQNDSTRFIYNSHYDLLHRLTGNYSETPIDPSKFERIREILGSVHDKVQEVIMSDFKLNINNKVLVRITDEGYQYLADKHNAFVDKYSLNWERHDVDYYKSKANADGYTEYQLWSFIYDFEGSFGIGFRPFFSTSIIVPGTSLEVINE